MPQTVEVRFKGTRRDFFLWPDDQEPLRLRESVVVEAERGHDFGRVNAAGEVALRKCGGCTGCAVGAEQGSSGAAEQAVETVESMPAPPAPPVPGSVAPTLRSVLRRATQGDIRVANDLRRTEEDARRQVIEKVRHHRLDMKVSDAEWQWDRSKLTIFFTADKRVDFRALVRDLAGLFRARIELRQIGVRDEAARLTGVGRCGREYCCSTWLTELSPVSLALAKDQHLSLNPAQISGGCGRLLCCLKYEHEFYVAARKRFPREGKVLQTANGPERVIAVDIFRERVFLRGEEQGPRIIPLVQLREELEAPAAVAAAAPGAGAAPGERQALPRRPEPRSRPTRGASRVPDRPRPPATTPDRPAPPTATPESPPSGQAPESQGRRSRRRRGRRRRGPPGGPSAPPPSPEA